MHFQSLIRTRPNSRIQSSPTKLRFNKTSKDIYILHVTTKSHEASNYALKATLIPQNNQAVVRHLRHEGATVKTHTQFDVSQHTTTLSSSKDNKNKMINHQRTPTPYKQNKTKGLQRPKTIPMHSTSNKMQERSRFE